MEFLRTYSYLSQKTPQTFHRLQASQNPVEANKNSEIFVTKFYLGLKHQINLINFN